MIAERLPPHIGGVETNVAGLTQALINRGHRITLVGVKHDPNLPDEEEINGARTIWLPTTGHKRRDYIWTWGWWAKHRSLLANADVVHFHDVYTLLHWFGPNHLLWLNKPIYLSYTGYEMRYPIRRRAKAYHWLAAHLVRGSICWGHFLIRWFDIKPQIVTYGGVTLPQKPLPSLPTPRVVFVGRVAPDTGLGIYLRGLGLLKRKHNLDLPFTVCGDGPLRAEMEHLAAEEKVNATFVGFTPKPTEYLAQGTIACTSGFLAILEAAALRRPIFSVYHNPVKESYLRDIPCAEEMLHIAGAPEELADQLAGHLLSPVHTAAMIDQAAAFAARHTWERLADDYLELWRDHQ
jgi:glycosyltransferase involved in cell wall biosynthesis